MNKERLEARRAELQRQHRNGEAQLAEVQMRLHHIEGAIALCDELLAEEKAGVPEEPA